MSKQDDTPYRFQWRESIARFFYRTRQFIRPVQQSSLPGMGALPNERGTTFRVWAPHAENVFVSGTFNRWSKWRSPLASEGNGHWSADIAHASTGDQYKYIIHHGDTIFARTDPYARAIVGPFQDGLICQNQFDWEDDDLPDTQTDPANGANGHGFRVPGWHELIIYELHVGTFHDRGKDAIGRFQDVIERLPYLQALGVNAIELMPVKRFPGDYSWGYNPSHPFAIAETYGGRNELKRLIKEAHRHGIAVIVDVVYNHFGPQELSMWRFDGWFENELGGIYFYNDWRSKTPWADTRPDYGRPEVRRFIKENVHMWFEEFRVDGLRWDATSYIRNAHGHDGDPGANIAEGWSLMQEINEELNTHRPGKIIIAEDLQNNDWITRSVADGGAGFDTQWDASFVHPAREAIITAYDEDRDMAALAAALSNTYNGDPIGRVIYTESHDEVANGKARVPEEIDGGHGNNIYAKKRSLLGAALVFTAPGIPMIFQGQEFLENGWFDDHDPLDWAKAGTNNGILELYRQLMRLRRNLDGRSRGLTGRHLNVFHINNNAKVIAYHRWFDGGPGDDIVVAANFANQHHEGYAIGLPRSGRWQVLLNSDSRTYAADFGDITCPEVIAAPNRPAGAQLDGLPFCGNLVLAPYSVLILGQIQ